MASDPEFSVSTCSKRLIDLRVIDLRNELEKRGLDKSGNKAALIERLSKDLKENGYDPDEFVFIVPVESPRKNLAKRTGTPAGKMTQKERKEADRDSDASESNDGPDYYEFILNSELIQNINETDEVGNKLETSVKTGLEAADIVEDALQLEVDEDEFEENRDEQILDLSEPRKDHIKVKREDRKREEARKRNQDYDKNGGYSMSSPKPEFAPVVAPLTEEDINAIRSKPAHKSGMDAESLIVNVDDTQSEIDADIDMSGLSSNTSDSKKNHSRSKEDSKDEKSFSSASTLSKEKDKQRMEQSNESKDSSKSKDRDSDGREGNSSTLSSKEASHSNTDNKSTTKTKSSPSKDSKSSASKDKKSLPSSSSNRNIWVSGLSNNTRASDLQILFKKYGKVTSAKIITNARIPGSRCYGFITMDTADQAEKCIENLNKTELHGRTIHVGKNRPSESSSFYSRNKSSSSFKKDKQNEKDRGEKDEEKNDEEKRERKDDKEKDMKREKDKEKEDKKDKVQSKSDADKKSDDKKEEPSENKTEGGTENSKEDLEKRKTKDGNERSKSRERKRTSTSPIRKPGERRRIPMARRPPLRRPVASFVRRGLVRPNIGSSRPNPVLLRRIETERVIRRRERERERRESERKRIEMVRYQREMERRAQDERERLEREKEKLRMERERLEREKAEIIRLERQKARYERERIEREREEMRRKQFQIPHHLDDNSRGGRNSSTVTSKRPYDARDSRDIDTYWDDRKKIQPRLDSAATVPPSGRAAFEPNVGSRFTDFDARNNHGPSYDVRGDNYKRTKMDLQSRGEYDMRRDSARHGGHDRDDRRSSGAGGSSSGGGGGTSSGGGGSGQSGYYRESSRNLSQNSSRDRERRGREDWKPSHESRREKYLEKGIASVNAGYGSRYSGSDRNDWSSGDRPGAASSMSKLSYNTGSSVFESRSRTSAPGLSGPILSSSGGQLSLFENVPNVPMPGMLHAGMSSTSGLSADDRSYMHSVRRF